ncbi:MAG: (E)-4-hydroxy-3-methylbut-2-enyl-diphosphate synthase [Alistipes sp.]|nr:(E)-4-hydroxy-3-methylbut-2-enyl-diphosphate synthase [Candidatus Minthomonas equi]
MKYISADIKGVKIGHGHPCVIQSMCNVDTNDIDSAVSQCRALHDAGSQLIRLTTQGLREVESLKQIKTRLHSLGISTPLVADIHFNSDAALAAASVADKVRINPGNFHRDHEQACIQFRKFLKICRDNDTAVRIGINHGSLGARITEKYGNTPEGMMEAIWEWVGMCQEEHFENIVLSLKASSVPVMVKAYRLLYRRMTENGVIYPLHVGVTEAGNGDMGRIKSAAGTATLLREGIGDTIRISLTENPVKEIPVAARVAAYIAEGRNPLLKDGTFRVDASTWEDFIIDAACAIGPSLLDRTADDFTLSGSVNGKELSEEKINSFKNDIMQATKRRITQCEYIACPSCGRTLYDIETVFSEVKRRTSQLKGLTIAVMGCIVNGPGEMADADYGYVGEGHGKVTLYRGKEAVLRSIPQTEAIDKLLALIESDKNK